MAKYGDTGKLVLVAGAKPVDVTVVSTGDDGVVVAYACPTCGNAPHAMVPEDAVKWDAPAET